MSFLIICDKNLAARGDPLGPLKTLLPIGFIFAPEKLIRTLRRIFGVGYKILHGRYLTRKFEKNEKLLPDPGMVPSAAVYAIKTTQTFGVWEK